MTVRHHAKWISPTRYEQAGLRALEKRAPRYSLSFRHPEGAIDVIAQQGDAFFDPQLPRIDFKVGVLGFLIRR